jgi:hypothetical protein
MFTLMLVIGVFLFAGTTTAYAVTEPSTDVTEVSPDGESESVQAMGGIEEVPSDTQFENPYSTSQEEIAPSEYATTVSTDIEATETSLPSGDNPFTPDGTGTVIDNTVNGEGKEFFTIETADGNVFYLIIDRARTADNVYLLNAVTEYDLASLAKPGDGKSESAVPTITPPATDTPDLSAEQPPEPPVEKSGTSTGTIIFIIIAVIAIGGAGYYFKIVRPKQSAVDDTDDYDEESDESDTYEDEPDKDEQDEDEEIPLSDDTETENNGE